MNTQDINFLTKMTENRAAMAEKSGANTFAKKVLPFDGEVEDDGFITLYSSIAI